VHIAAEAPGGHAADDLRARAVVDQHKIADPNGDFLAAIRIDRVVTGKRC